MRRANARIQMSKFVIQHGDVDYDDSDWWPTTTTDDEFLTVFIAAIPTCARFTMPGLSVSDVHIKTVDERGRLSMVRVPRRGTQSMDSTQGSPLHLVEFRGVEDSIVPVVGHANEFNDGGGSSMLSRVQTKSLTHLLHFIIQHSS